MSMTTTASPALEGTIVPAPRWDADEAVTALYVSSYRPMVRLAVLLVGSAVEAEELVQDSFVALHGRWWRLRDHDRALAYLRSTVVNRCRSALRHRRVVDRHLPAPLDDAPSAEHAVLTRAARGEVVAALHRLPTRQREVLVLRYYGDLSEAEIATTLGISRGAVKSHASRGMAALRTTLGDDR